MKWLETVNGYVTVDNAKRFTVSDIGDAVQILMWVDDNIEHCVVVNECDYSDEADAVNAMGDAFRELEFIINYISDGDVCAYEQYTQHTNIRYVEEVND